MSKAPGSPARSRSRSYSRSPSRTRSRSRSRKNRYSSRSRSRSRSPSHGRNYPSRDYQNNRGFRGYNRGFRRPYYYRGRTRGYYPRGRFQRGGGNYGYRTNNWQGGGNWHHHDQDQHPHSPRRGRSRSRTPRKRSASRSRSRYSDRSSSGRSRRSRHSSYSSRSSSPARRSRSGKTASKEAKDKLPEAPGERPGAKGAGGDSSHQEKPSGGKWKGVREYDGSPKPSGAQSQQAAAEKQGPAEEANSKGASSGGALWRTVSSPPPSKSPPKTGATAFGGFGFFSKEDAKPPGDKTAISSAFKKFLAESQVKKREEGEDGERSSSDEQEAERVQPAALFSSLDDPKEHSSLPFFDVEEEQFLRAQGLKDREGEGQQPRSQQPRSGQPRAQQPRATLTARDIFGKWEDEASYYKDKSVREAEEEVQEDLEHLEKELYHSRKLLKKEDKPKKKDKKEKRSPALSPLVSRGGDKPLFPSARQESPVRRPSGKREDFELKVNSFDDMPSFSGVLKGPRVCADLVPSKRDQEFRSIFDHLQQAQLRRSPSELFAQHIVTIVHYIKAQHFPSSGMTLSERFAMYQRKAAQTELMKPRRSPEIHRRIDVSPSVFKRHSQLFEEMEETCYKEQSKKAKGDVMDLRLDIERRKRFAAKEYKQDGDKGSGGSGGSRGLSPDKPSEKAAKHHKKSKKSKKRRERSPSSSSSSSPSPSFRGKAYMAEGMEHMEGFSKHRFSPRDYPGPSGPLERGPGPRGPGDRGPMDRSPRDYDMDRGRGRGFVPRGRGRGWSRGGYPGNNNSSNGNAPPVSAPVRPPEEEWDPEYTPKSRKYYFHDDREGEKSWLEGRGRGRGAFPRSRGRFICRKGGSSPKWTHDLFQAPEAGAGAGEEDGPEADLKDSKPQDSDSKL